MATSDEGTVFTFTWKIENISLYAKDIDAELSSPSFTIGTTKPAEFQVYLTSGDWPKSICLRTLRRPLLLCKQSELSLLRADGEVIESCFQRGYLAGDQFFYIQNLHCLVMCGF